MIDDLTELPGIGPNLEERLNRAGYQSFEHLAYASKYTDNLYFPHLEPLTDVYGISRSTADDIIHAAQERVDGEHWFNE